MLEGMRSKARGRGRVPCCHTEAEMDPFDFSTVEARYGKIVEVDPLARLHLRLHFDFLPGDWWVKASDLPATSAGGGDLRPL